jgi:hypothetical protein
MGEEKTYLTTDFTDGMDEEKSAMRVILSAAKDPS